VQVMYPGSGEWSLIAMHEIPRNAAELSRVTYTGVRSSWRADVLSNLGDSVHCIYDVIDPAADDQFFCCARRSHSC
jgi:hypothetical protein